MIKHNISKVGLRHKTQQVVDGYERLCRVSLLFDPSYSAKIIKENYAGDKMDFYTVVLRKSGGYWVALCLENGLVGQGDTKESAIEKLKEAIDSFDDVYKEEQEEIKNRQLNLLDKGFYLGKKLYLKREDLYE